MLSPKVQVNIHPKMDMKKKKERIWLSLEPMLKQMAAKHSRNIEETAEDLMGEYAVAICYYIEKYPLLPYNKMVNWCKKLCKFKSLDPFKKKLLQAGRLADVGITTTISNDKDEISFEIPASNFSNAFMSCWFREIWDTLSILEVEIFQKHLEDKTSAEKAADMGMSVCVYYKHLNGVKEKFAEFMAA